MLFRIICLIIFVYSFLYCLCKFWPKFGSNSVEIRSKFGQNLIKYGFLTGQLSCFPVRNSVKIWNSSNSVWSEFFSNLNPKTLAVRECGLGQDPVPQLADQGGAYEARRVVGREAEEDLGDGVADQLRRRWQPAISSSIRRRSVWLERATFTAMAGSDVSVVSVSHSRYSAVTRYWFSPSLSPFRVRHLHFFPAICVLVPWLFSPLSGPPSRCSCCVTFFSFVLLSCFGILIGVCSVLKAPTEYAEMTLSEGLPGEVLRAAVEFTRTRFGGRFGT
jgi:hypothetical protein